jgi:hypothetical protein
MFKGETVKDGADVFFRIYLAGDRALKDVWVVRRNSPVPVGPRD